MNQKEEKEEVMAALKKNDASTTKVAPGDADRANSLALGYKDEPAAKGRGHDKPILSSSTTHSPTNKSKSSSKYKSRSSGSKSKPKHYLSIATDDDQTLTTTNNLFDSRGRNGPVSWKGSIFSGKFQINFNMNPIVFILSTIIIWGFTTWCLVDRDNASTQLYNLQTYLVESFSWLYIGSICIFMILMVYLAVHPKYSQIKLGKPHEKPQYSMVTWFSMLFSAGYGIGLYFYGVAECVLHFRDSTEGVNRYSNLPEQQQLIYALNLQWFHGGFVGLSIYCVIGLLMAFLSHKYDLPMTMRTCFYPIIGNRIYSFVGDIIDISAVVATMFGLCTALGLGVMQINAGMTRVFGEDMVPNNSSTQIIMIWVITILASISVVTGVDKGIKILSQINFGFGSILVFYLFFIGDPFFILNLFVEVTGVHFNELLILLFDTDSFEQIGFDKNSNSRAWMSYWTVFFWAWWIAWSPFVGTFIAQISKGRTVREFILGNMLIPAFVVNMWMTIMGGLGLRLEFNAYSRGIGNECFDQENGIVNPHYNGTITDGEFTRLSCIDAAEQLFILIEYYPLSQFISILAITGILGYFITSSDSASFVIDLITSNGCENTPKIQKIFWACTEGAVAHALLAIGGDIALNALQTVSIVSALPFTFILLAMVYALLKAFNMEDQLNKHFYNDNNIDKKTMQSTSNTNNSNDDDQVYPGSMNLKYVEDENWSKLWKFEFFNGLFYNFKTFVMAIITPCIFQYKTGKTIGIYGSEHGCCINFIWITFIFIPPILFIILHILQIWHDGCSSLAWCVYVFFVFIGLYHRVSIRQYFRIKGNVLTDLVSYLCCYCFAVSQEYTQCNKSFAKL